jgi:hypothetical protein
MVLPCKERTKCNAAPYWFVGGGVLAAGGGVLVVGAGVVAAGGVVPAGGVIAAGAGGLGWIDISSTSKIKVELGPIVLWPRSPYARSLGMTTCHFDPAGIS